MLRPLLKQSFTIPTPPKGISKRTFTITSRQSSHTPIGTTIPSRNLTFKAHRPAPFYPARISNHAFTRTFKVYPLYPQLPVATTMALAYFSFPKVNGVSNATSYYAALPLSTNFSYQNLECEVRCALRESCRMAMQTQDRGEKDVNEAEAAAAVGTGDIERNKEEEMRKLKLDITVVWQEVKIGNLWSGPEGNEEEAEMSISGMNKEELGSVLSLMAMRGWKDVFCVRVGGEERKMEEQEGEKYLKRRQMEQMIA
ncbi:hypothetical protein BOTCAL_0092g00200 [Botryotinia calthae]|uniref:Uncharacterized protein n=1 Tax=Botryotinia calthae TaxID=38488 RepID=A0A4Y8D6W4_9HELO|nr:hypothetical protein BOTCAL_0092g00200 [Botryotinia calthae]